MIVVAIDKAGVQALGMAFNIKPCFFAKHLGFRTTRKTEPNELSGLGNNFASLGTSENPVRRTVEASCHFDTPMTKPVYMDLYKWDNALRADKSVADWISPGTDRILYMPDTPDNLRQLYPQISCCQELQYGC